MEKKEIQEFISNYKSEDRDKIRFVWNGKHGAEFEDKNFAFRNMVCEYSMFKIDEVNLDLLRDLYLEEANHAKESTLMSMRFSLLAQEILARGGTKYVMDYIRGAAVTFETFLMSGNIEIPRTRTREILEFLDKKMQTSDEEEKKMIERIAVNRLNAMLKR